MCHGEQANNLIARILKAELSGAVKSKSLQFVNKGRHLRKLVFIELLVFHRYDKERHFEIFLWYTL